MTKLNEIAESNDKSLYLTFKETTLLLNMTESLLRKLVFDKKIPVKRFGGKLMFNRDETLNWAESQY